MSTFTPASSCLERAGVKTSLWRRHVDRVVDVVRVLRQVEIEGVALLGPDAGQADVELVADRAGGEAAIEAGHGAGVVLVVGNERAGGDRAAIVADQGRAVVVADFGGVAFALGQVEPRT
jgi:hypothetical protein